MDSAAPSRPALGVVVLALAGATLVGCIGRRPPYVERRLSGELRRGIFVSPYSYEHFVRGELARAREQWERAAREYRAARAGPEDDPLLIARLAEAYDRLGMEERAAEVLADGRRLDPESETIWIAFASFHRAHGRPDDALEAYAEAERVAPRSARPAVEHATLLRELNREAEAAAVLERFVARGESAETERARLHLAVFAEDPLAAASAVRALLGSQGASRQDIRLAAQSAIAGNRPELALRLLAALPWSDDDRPLRLTAAVGARDHDAAEAVLSRWMAVRPDELVEVGAGYLAIGRAERATELARTAIAAGGTSEAQLLLGRALYAAGRTGEAMQTLGRIPVGAGASDDAALELARILRAHGRPALAAELLNTRFAVDETSRLEVRIALSGARMDAGDARGALAVLGGDAPRLVVERARVLERAGDSDAAAELYATLSPEADVPPRDLARIRAERHWAAAQRTEAIEILRAWLQVAPEDLPSRTRLARWLRADGDSSAADSVEAELQPNPAGSVAGRPESSGM